MACTRVTIMIPEELTAEMDRYSENRGLFVTEAIRTELARRRKERLIQSLQHPHPESAKWPTMDFVNGSAWGGEFALGGGVDLALFQDHDFSEFSPKEYDLSRVIAP